MINVDAINREIEGLKEKGSMSWDTMEKLCWLYTVRDHLQMEEGGEMKIGFSRSKNGQNIRPTKNGELERIEESMTREEIANEFNRHMDDIKDRHPMDYEDTVRRMRENYNRRRDYR